MNPSERIFPRRKPTSTPKAVPGAREQRITRLGPLVSVYKKLVFDIPAVMPDEAPRLAAVMAGEFSEAGISVEIVEHADRAGYSEMVREKKIHDACCFDSSPRSPPLTNQG